MNTENPPSIRYERWHTSKHYILLCHLLLSLFQADVHTVTQLQETDFPLKYYDSSSLLEAAPQVKAAPNLAR